MHGKPTIESLISTVGTDPERLSAKMNLQEKAIIINQKEDISYQEITYNSNHIKEYGFMERGVGKSRNEALIRTEADICLMADDDMVYVDNYPDIVKKAYERYPDADFIIFNVRIHTKHSVTEKVKKESKVTYFNSLKYGTVTFSFKRKAIQHKNIFFSLLFGGGAKYSNGEDSLFLWDCLKRGLRVYAVTDTIADVYNYDSSWFSGYNEKFFLDRGTLFKALSSKFARLLIYQYAIRKYKVYKDDISFRKSIQLMLKGANDFKNRNF